MTKLAKVTNFQLERLLKEDLKVDNFVGVYPADMWPKRLGKGKSFISNTDPSDLPGEHYVAFFKHEKNTFFYFDPLAQPIEHYSYLWRRNGQRYRTFVAVLNSPIQAALSRFCGYFCCNYILAQNRKYATCIRPFTLNPSKLAANDVMAVRNLKKCLVQRNK